MEASTNGCPHQYVCSISLEAMVNPVKLKQTGQIYDHASFHEWLTRGGSICPMTGTRLKNPIILQPQAKLRREIWRYQQQQQGTRLQKAQELKLDHRGSSLSEEEDVDSDFWRSSFQTDRLTNLANKKEQDVQYQLARDRIPSTPAESGPPLYQVMLSWLYKRSQAIVQPKRPSTYFVSHGNHVYCRGDLY